MALFQKDAKSYAQMADKTAGKAADSTLSIVMNLIESEASKGLYECNLSYISKHHPKVVLEIKKRKMKMVSRKDPNKSGFMQAKVYWGPTKKPLSGGDNRKPDVWVKDNTNSGYK